MRKWGVVIRFAGRFYFFFLLPGAPLYLAAISAAATAARCWLRDLTALR